MCSRIDSLFWQGPSAGLKDPEALMGTSVSVCVSVLNYSCRESWWWVCKGVGGVCRMTAMSEHAPPIRHDKQLTHFCCSEDSMWPGREGSHMTNSWLWRLVSLCTKYNNSDFHCWVSQECFCRVPKSWTHTDRKKEYIYPFSHTCWVVHACPWINTSNSGRIQCCHGNRATNLARKQEVWGDNSL